MKLRLLPEIFGILKLTPPQPFPDWLQTAGIYFVAQTEDEFSVMCPQQHILAGIDYDADWRCFRVEDVAYDEVGVVARVSQPLADAGLSLFLVSTHDRDYVFVAESNLQQAIDHYKIAQLDVTE
ncbi:MAG: ACT domain-containing protein [Anaerolineae bacterium]|nr:ACT domain-containing protein [Anaerolineae bacterium]